MIDAILGGERDPLKLAALCEKQVLNKKQAEVLKSLEGDWQEHHLFALRQALEAYRFYHVQIAACDAQIEAVLRALNAGRDRRPPSRGRKSKSCATTRPRSAICTANCSRSRAAAMRA